MYTTRITLLGRLKEGRDSPAWQQFYDLYGPFLYHYARRRGLAHSDAEDVVGECFRDLAKALPEFDYQPGRGRFKNWLKRIANFKIANLLRQHSPAQSLSMDYPDPDSHGDVHDRVWDEAWRHKLLNYCSQKIKTQVPPATYHAFYLNAIEGWNANRVADALGVTVDQVYRMKYKVVQLIREMMAGMASEDE